MDAAFKRATCGGRGHRSPTKAVMRVGGGGALVAVESYVDPGVVNPDTCELLEEVRANVDLLEHVTEERLKRLTAKQLVGVVGDLLAMAAQSERERAQRFREAMHRNALARESTKVLEERSVRARIRKEREWLEQRRRHTDDAARQLVETDAAVRIQRHARGFVTRRRLARKREKERDMRRYNQMLPYLEERAGQHRRREAAARTIQARQRGIMARERCAKMRWFKEMNAQHQALVRAMEEREAMKAAAAVKTNGEPTGTQAQQPSVDGDVQNRVKGEASVAGVSTSRRDEGKAEDARGVLKVGGSKGAGGEVEGDEEEVKWKKIEEDVRRAKEREEKWGKYQDARMKAALARTNVQSRISDEDSDGDESDDDPTPRGPRARRDV